MTVKESKRGGAESCLLLPAFFFQWLLTTIVRVKRAQCITDQVVSPGSVVGIQQRCILYVPSHRASTGGGSERGWCVTLSAGSWRSLVIGHDCLF